MTAILDELTWRGVLAQTTDADVLAAELAAGPTTFYVGFDPTAPSLHIGHLVQVLTARRLQRAGHRPIVLVGGATGLIGDPKESGERTLQDPATVAGWTDRLRSQLTPFLDLDGPAAATLVDNLEWTAPLSAIELLRDVGRHFSVNRMLDRDAVATRLAAGGISYTEFSYVLLQSHDYLELYRRYGCRLQLGGSDQWGNITAGVELVRRAAGGRVHALSTVLVTKADGTKFGKTEGGAVWLDPELTSPYAFYQFWVNVADADVLGYLRVFTDRDRDDLDRLAAEVHERPQARSAQRALAGDLTTLVHGARATEQAVAASQALFGRGDLAALDEPTLAAALSAAGSVTVTGDPPPVVQLLQRTGLCASLSEARRTVTEGGAYVNNVRVGDPEQGPGAPLTGGWWVLRRGKRTVAGVRHEG